MKNMMTANGQTHDNPNLFERMKIKKFRQYGAESREEYEKKLSGMSTYALAEEAARLGLAGRFSNDRRRIVRTLVSQYTKDKADYDILINNIEVCTYPSQESQENIKKIFNYHR